MIANGIAAMSGFGYGYVRVLGNAAASLLSEVGAAKAGLGALAWMCIVGQKACQRVFMRQTVIGGLLGHKHP